MSVPIPSLISEMERQFLGTKLNEHERYLARLCWLGGAWALFKGLAESKVTGNTHEVQKAYAEELKSFVEEVRGS
jgi:hypothetical protein